VLSGFEVFDVDVRLPDFFPDGDAADSQKFGGLSLIAAGFLQSINETLPVDLRFLPAPGRSGTEEFRRQIVERNPGSGGRDDGPLDDVSEFADVAGPGMIHDSLKRVSGDAG